MKTAYEYLIEKQNDFKISDFSKFSPTGNEDVARIMDDYHKQKMEGMMPSEVQEAIDFIEENPDQDAFVSEHVRHFMNYGEADDNSIDLASYWHKQLSMVNNWAIKFKSLLTQ